MKRDLDARRRADRPPSLAIVTPAGAGVRARGRRRSSRCIGSTAASIVAIWWRSETFAHGFVVIPICLWFVWRKRAELALTPARPWWPGLCSSLARRRCCGSSAAAADVQACKQFALAFMLQAAIVTIVGLRVARVLAFPLAFPALRGACRRIPRARR